MTLSMPAGAQEQDQSIDSSGEYQEPAAGATRRRTQAPARQMQGSRGKGGRLGGSQASHQLCAGYRLGSPAQRVLPGSVTASRAHPWRCMRCHATAGLPGMPAWLQPVTLTPGADCSRAFTSSSSNAGCAPILCRQSCLFHSNPINSFHVQASTGQRGAETGGASSSRRGTATAGVRPAALLCVLLSLPISPACCASEV